MTGRWWELVTSWRRRLACLARRHRCSRPFAFAAVRVLKPINLSGGLSKQRADLVSDLARDSDRTVDDTDQGLVLRQRMVCQALHDRQRQTPSAKDASDPASAASQRSRDTQREIGLSPQLTNQPSRTTVRWAVASACRCKPSRRLVPMPRFKANRSAAPRRSVDSALCSRRRIH